MFQGSRVPGFQDSRLLGIQGSRALTSKLDSYGFITLEFENQISKLPEKKEKNRLVITSNYTLKHKIMFLN